MHLSVYLSSSYGSQFGQQICGDQLRYICNEFTNNKYKYKYKKEEIKIKYSNEDNTKKFLININDVKKLIDKKFLNDKLYHQCNDNMNLQNINDYINIFKTNGIYFHDIDFIDLEGLLNVPIGDKVEAKSEYVKNNEEQFSYYNTREYILKNKDRFESLENFLSKI